MTERKPTARERARARRAVQKVTPHEMTEAHEADDREGRCTAHNRKGRLCRMWAIPGGTVCLRHGGSASQVKKAAALRLLALADPAISALAQIVRDKNATAADRARAAVAILDRAGLGPNARIEFETKPYEVLLQTMIDKWANGEGVHHPTTPEELEEYESHPYVARARAAGRTPGPIFKIRPRAASEPRRRKPPNPEEQP